MVPRWHVAKVKGKYHHKSMLKLSLAQGSISHLSLFLSTSAFKSTTICDSCSVVINVGTKKTKMILVWRQNILIIMSFLLANGHIGLQNI